MPNCSAGLAGLTISYAIRTTQNLSFAVRAFTALENTFTSPERVFRLMDVPQEATTKHQLTLSPGFHTSPFQPTLVAENIYCKYHVDSEPILKGVSFKVYPQLTGICGRTGGGKSTLALVISRCLDETQGRMTLCGVNVLDIPLERYRSLVQVYPQDCFLLSGTVRSFLDPHLYFTDLKLNSILNELSTAIGGEGEEDLYSRPTLSSSIHSGGSNLSAGQKQLLALARAALATEAKIVILDEITSNMDARASLKAIHILKNELLSRSIAVILIAHVIKDILACNVVFVMADGLIVEQGKPDYLLSDSESALTQMVKEQEQNAVHSSSRAKG